MKNSFLSESVLRFQKGLISRRDFLKLINSVILNYPFHYGSFDTDLRHDFYSVVISKIDKIINSYKEQENAQFSTWFNTVLRNEFFCLMKKKKREIEKLEALDVYAENHIQPFSSNECSDKKNDDRIDLSILTDNEKKVVSLKYGINSSGEDISGSINIILERLEKKKRLENKISERYIKIVSFQKMLSNEIEETRKNRIKEELTKTTKSKRRFENTYQRFSLLPTNKWVGLKLGLSEGTIASYISKIKIKFRRRIEEVTCV